MRAFLSGSRVYGQPREDSDLDLIILVDEVTKRELLKYSDKVKGKPECVKFGILNIICCTDELQYAAFKTATAACKRRVGLGCEKLTREESLKTFKKVREMMGILDETQSGGDPVSAIRSKEYHAKEAKKWLKTAKTKKKSVADISREVE